MIKICFIMPKAYAVFKPSSSSKIGGAEVQTALWAKELAKDKNFQVSFVVGDFGQPKVEIIDGVKLFRFVDLSKKKSFFKKLFLMFKLWGLLKKINSQIYLTTTANGVAGVVNIFCRIFGKKHVHRTANQYNVDGSYDKRGIDGKLYRLGLTRADLVITQNFSHQKLLKKFYKKESVVIKNSNVLSPNKRGLRLEDREYVFQVTRFFDWKRPELFLELARRFPEEKFLLCCQKGEDEEDEKWKQFKKQAKKIRNLDFIEKIPFDEIQDYYDKAKVFINTSEFEGFPNTFIESGIGRTPLLSLDVNPDGFIDEYECGYFGRGDFQQMTRQLKELLTNREDWGQKSKNIFRYVRENHDIKVNIEKIKDNLKKLAKEK